MAAVKFTEDMKERQAFVDLYGLIQTYYKAEKGKDYINQLDKAASLYIKEYDDVSSGMFSEFVRAFLHIKIDELKELYDKPEDTQLSFDDIKY